MQYIHKKNNDGSPLKVTAVKWADRISIHCFDKTKKTEGVKSTQETNC